MQQKRYPKCANKGIPLNQTPKRPFPIGIALAQVFPEFFLRQSSHTKNGKTINKTGSKSALIFS